MQYTQHLQQAGLTADQSALYEVLIKEGAMIASRLARLAHTNRTLTYKLLDELIGLGLVEADSSQGHSVVFVAKHPSSLQELIDIKLKDAQNAKAAMSGVLSSIISDYNKVSGQPGVRILEGESGMREALDETLQSGGAIYTYADLTTIKGKIGKLNTEYVKNRFAKKVEKKILVPNTKENKTLAAELMAPYTEIRFIAERDAQHFTTAMEIYGNTVSYLTFTGGRLIATLIEDTAVHAMHEYLFEDAWDRAIR